ncbi:MAG: aminotransferase class V-fold PLP-dependent enzyme [Planctomycetaceae bacterium]|jgi:cysteine desulfurase family protein|nr:aminotransferase class V-fold PLP-dependent enzyme [Planctomycetaceae bacterium]
MKDSKNCDVLLRRVYLDNAATSFPKPETVYLAVDNFMRNCGGSAGRGGHYAAVETQRIIDDARLLCAKLFNAASPKNIAFTHNATTAINFALKGILSENDHVITGSFEHNSVTRPLHSLANRGINVTKINSDLDRGLDKEQLKTAIRRNTKLVICNHLSNVFGTENDICGIGQICRERGILFMVDAAQSAGVKLIDVQEMCIDLLAFSGHKSLFGLQGTGGLYVASGVQVRPLIEGGTGGGMIDGTIGGVNSSALLNQPAELPYSLESGTINAHGIAGLAAGLRFIFETGIDKIAAKEAAFVECLIDGLRAINGIRVIAPAKEFNRGSVVSFQHNSILPEQFAAILDAGFGIAIRGGLHCAVAPHEFIGTINSGGTVRISPNYFNCESDIDYCLRAIKNIVK